MPTTCTTCGAPLVERATVCPTCGAVVHEAVGGGPAQPHGPTGGAYPPPGAAASGDVSSEARTWGLVAHLSTFVGAWLALAFLGPLVVWLIRREVEPFSARHAREALNFNLTLVLVVVVGAVTVIPLALLTVGLILIPFALAALAIAVGWVVLTVVAAVKASEGRDYRYPLTIRFVR